MENQVVHRFPRRQDEEVYVTLREFKNRHYLDVRIFFQPKDGGEMRATRKGLTLEVELLPELKKGILALEKKASTLETVAV